MLETVDCNLFSLIIYSLKLYLLFADERERVQKKTFTKWINSHLQRVGARVNDLYHDLQDGKKLILLLEILSGEKLVSISAVWNLLDKITSHVIRFNDCPELKSSVLCCVKAFYT